MNIWQSIPHGWTLRLLPMFYSSNRTAMNILTYVLLCICARVSLEQGKLLSWTVCAFAVWLPNSPPQLLYKFRLKLAVNERSQFFQNLINIKFYQIFNCWQSNRGEWLMAFIYVSLYSSEVEQLYLHLLAI